MLPQRRWLLCLLVLVTAGLTRPVAVRAQVGLINERAVGGIAIDTDGLLQNATVDALGQLQAARAKALSPIPTAIGPLAGQRKVSLRRLQAAIAECHRRGQPLPDTIRYLAGLQRIRYVLVYPEQNDIVLVGPGEGWKIGPQGEVVGVTTGRPVMLLDDLAVALRAAQLPGWAEITCSIDPTAAGITAIKEQAARLQRMKSPKAVAAGLERALGRQQITIAGVPGESHFARVLVAADYRMKRIAMDFEPAPVQGLPSFLRLVDATNHGMREMMPRWWLAPDYQPLLRDEAGLAWEIRGPSVKTLTEDDVFDAAGQRQQTGKANATAQRWADAMTAKYDELALREPVFGQLQNCMDLAIAAALLAHEGLAEKAHLNLDVLLSPTQTPTAQFAAPKSIDSCASLLRKGDDWVISVSGGVKIEPKKWLERAERSQRFEPIYDESKLGVHADWWWN